MDYTKKELYDIAYNLCMPLIDRTAVRLKNHTTGLSLDRAGYACSELENFCRGFMGIAPVLQEKNVTVRDGETEQDFLSWWCTTLLDGCDIDNKFNFERGRASMGDNFFYNQSITEICCMLVFSYFAKEHFWEKLSAEKKDVLATKMLEWAERALADSWQNNHLWFPILSLVVLKKLGYEAHNYEKSITAALQVLDGMYIGDGWYQDGEFGRFDYYVGWSLHLYPLWWSILEDDTFPGAKQRKISYINRTEQFLPQFMYWFDSEGANVLYGRSLSYRFAAVALFPTAALAGCQFEWGSAKKLMFDNINFYMKNCKIPEDGVLPPGIFYDNRGFVESYTSDGGAYWCAKTFLALFISDDHEFWQCELKPYPSQMQNYLEKPWNSRVTMEFASTRQTGVTLYNNIAHYQQNGVFLHHFNDMAGYYSKFAYNSKAGFSISCRDLVSFDSMISLQTPDFTMQSHRLGFEPFGIIDEVMYSKHLPFANDADTVITSALLPIEGSLHVRVHKVVLAKPYIVREGGFSLPFYEDEFLIEIKENASIVKTNSLYSIQKNIASVSTKAYLEMPKPGHHAYAPMCGYPAYETDLLASGTYYFGSIYAVSCENTDISNIEILLDESDIKVLVNNETKHIDFSNCSHV